VVLEVLPVVLSLVPFFDGAIGFVRGDAANRSSGLPATSFYNLDGTEHCC
jgi:hypothetical protein